MNKYLLLVFSFLFMGLGGALAQTYTVNTSSLGVGGPMDTNGSLDVMITNALSYANSGNTAIVNLNAPSLVNVNGLLPVIKVTHPSGKIVIQEDPTAAVDQGISRYGMVLTGFKISECQGDVEIVNLRVENFTEGVYIAPLGEGTPGNILIDNNYFYGNTKAGVLVFSTAAGGAFEQINITNNTFEGLPYFHYTTLNAGIRFDFIETCSHPNLNTATNVLIDGNTISHYREGIHFVNVEVVAESEMTVSINGNNISWCHYGMRIANYKEETWSLTNNIFSNIYYTGLTLETYLYGVYESCQGHDLINSPFPSNFKMIESGSLEGFTANNIGNKFYTCKYHAILLDQMDEVYIVNMTLEGSVRGIGGIPYHIRDNIIKKPADYYDYPFTTFQPILWSSGVNNDIPSPNPIAALEDAGDLTVSYALSGLEEVNAPFKLEFYIANEDRSLVEMITQTTIPTADDIVSNEVFTGFTFDPGQQIAMSLTSLGGTDLGTSEFSYIQIDQVPCDTCSSFKPEAGKQYWLSAWVQESHLDPVKSYENANVQLNFVGGSETSVQFYPTGEIIDGWQRIVGKFTMPDGVTLMNLQLNAHPSVDTYFDDIRIHPFNGSMKSYVYDGETFWLTAELDDNNYATFYEYDQEGGLIRIKKETSRGVVTIQETRSNTLKEGDE